MTEIPPGLADWARKTGPALLLDAVRHRARRGWRVEEGVLNLELDSVHRKEIGLLLGTRWEVSGARLRLQDVAAGLAEHGIGSVRAFVEALDGEPLVDERARRARAREKARIERETAIAALTGAGVAEPHAATWLADTGLPRPGEGGLLSLVHKVIRTWRALPRAGEPIRLAALAADLWQNAHALDADEPLGKAVARLAAITHGLDRPLRPGLAWRAAWASVGVRCDGVSSRVLCLNLPLSGDAPAAKLCAATPGEPVWLPLRSLAGSWQVTHPRTVYVCENPTVLEAAADAHGAGCAPLVCTWGHPSVAVLDLLAGLVGTGCRLRIRADVDEAGLSIVEQLLAVAPQAELWRYDADVYATALGLSHLSGAGSVAGHLADLRALHAATRTPLHEEAVLDILLADLVRSAS